ncbi:MAG: cell wall metabolism sensor histidine kinase WalK [Tepidanaerobacter acetatoxydans]|uniref:two-component system histidine kinase PnpS n=1 Tax=Tepidanaerobacter acetatoxydans TaxID=499229 RepID=UPI0026EEEF9E|nr:HAMP domain-containing sensor histidine kinase [Tepidanaerobacter acetatoxydans]NLU10166.1 cell wall metabolism sensor histidine kinase WalK [Tepidanaerobacter acetatoxydans]
MKRKLFTAFFILILTATLTTGLLSINFIGKIYVNNIKNKLISNGNLIIETLLQKEQQNNTKIVYFNLAQKFAKKVDARITFLDINGIPLADSEDNSIIFEDYSNKQEIIEAVNGRIGVVTRRSPAYNKNYMYVAMPPVYIRDKYIVTCLSVPLKQREDLNMEFIQYTIYAILIGMFVAIPIGLWYTQAITRPINEIINSSKSIAMGNFEQKVVVKTGDEIENLADNFNNMAEKLSIMIQELYDKNIKLDLILKNMTDGIIAVDTSGKVIMMNPAFKKMFNIISKTKGVKVWEFLPTQELQQMMKYTLEQKISIDKEIVIKNTVERILRVQINPIEKYGKQDTIGVLATFSDITEMKRLEKLKTEFVINASHELKTPLTSISGYIETLKLGAIENDQYRDKFIDILEKETERLKKIVEDLLNLAQVENLKPAKNKEPIYLAKAVDQVFDIFLIEAEKKNLSLMKNIDKNLTAFVYSKDLFKQMLINLIDNSIKYTPPNGRIIVSAAPAEDGVIITVEDNGIGIPQKDIPRIFERFYRVDKNRSRKVGGTGLGLAIVKHIVLAHDGEITVESILGQGSKFSISLPGN